MKTPKTIEAILNANVLNEEGLRKRDIICLEGKIIDIRNIKERPRRLPKRNILDVEGRIVTPGMIDCHIHFFGVALRKVTIDLSSSKSITEMQRRIKYGISDHSGKTRWIVGRGWDQDLFEEKRYPNSSDIDAVIASRPALFVRTCGHIGVINSAAARLCGDLTRFSSELVPRSKDGAIKGIVKEAALDYVWKNIPPPSSGLMKRLFLKTQEEALSVGLVGVHCILSENWEEELEIIRSLDSENRLILKISLFLPVSALGYVEKLKLHKRKRMLQGKNFVTLGFKLFSDGSLGARTASLQRPYADDPENSGILYHQTHYMKEVASSVKKIGMILATHAIGDRAVAQVIRAYKDAGIKSFDGFRIEHCSVVNPAILKELGEVEISVQPSFIVSDYWINSRLGKERAALAYPLRTLLHLKKGDLIGGSDSPVESINPITGISAALKNRTCDESLTLNEAFKLYTSNAASKSSLTISDGDLLVGKSCTVTIFDCKKLDDVCSARVSAVIIDGRLAYNGKLKV